MKRLFTFILCAVLLTGCTASSSKPQSTDRIGVEKLSQSGDDLLSALDSIKNLEASDIMQITAPQAEKLYEFTFTSVKEDEPKAAIEHFKSLFSELFGDAAFDGKMLKCVASTDSGAEVISVSDNMADILSGRIKTNMFFYDDTQSSAQKRAFLLAQSGISSGLLNFSRGEFCTEYLRCTNSQQRPSLELFAPDMNVGERGEYVPMMQSEAVKSSDTVRLIDKEVTVSQAAQAFEKSIEGLSIYKNAAFGIKCLNARKYTLPASQVCCLQFDIRLTYKGTQLDDCPVTPDGYDFFWGSGYMIRSSGADHVYTAGLEFEISDEKPIDSIISLGEAARIISAQLTDQVVFKVESAELVYSQRSPKQQNWGEDSRATAPAWKLTLFNANDNHYYYCYVDAKDGGNFRYAAKEKTDK